jgi:hypothetical protein
MSNVDLIWASSHTLPKTFFISEDGTIITEPVIGMNIGAYSRALDQALALVG